MRKSKFNQVTHLAEGGRLAVECIIEIGRNNRRTKFMKMIRSSGTPWLMMTSTAFIADPPVAVCR